MAWNDYLSLFQFGTVAQLPPAAQLDTMAKKIPQLYYATDVNGLLVYNPTTLAWELQYQVKPVTVANLPTANLITGTEAVVSDATAPAVGATVAGAGAVQCAVIWNGAAWKVA